MSVHVAMLLCVIGENVAAALPLQRCTKKGHHCLVKCRQKPKTTVCYVTESVIILLAFNRLKKQKRYVFSVLSGCFFLL